MDQPLFLILLTHTVCLVSYIIFRQERTKKVFVSCSRKIEVFKKYDFNSGDYELYGIITMGTTIEFTEKVGEFKIKDITTLESMQSEWVLNTTNRRMLCGYSYDLYLMKGASARRRATARCLPIT